MIWHDPDKFFFDEDTNVPDTNVGKSVTNQNRLSNADRIRAMSDEELAEAFAYQCMGRVCKGIPFGGENECVSCWLDWLKAVVE